MQNRGARRGRSAGGGSSKRNAGTSSIPYDPVLARLEGARCRERGAIERERFVHRRSPPLSAFLFPTSCFPFFSLSVPPPQKIKCRGREPPPEGHAQARRLLPRALRGRRRRLSRRTLRESRSTRRKRRFSSRPGRRRPPPAPAAQAGLRPLWPRRGFPRVGLPARGKSRGRALGGAHARGGGAGGGQRDNAAGAGRRGLRRRLWRRQAHCRRKSAV